MFKLVEIVELNACYALNQFDKNWTIFKTRLKLHQIIYPNNLTKPKRFVNSFLEKS